MRRHARLTRLLTASVIGSCIISQKTRRFRTPVPSLAARASSLLDEDTAILGLNLFGKLNSIIRGKMSERFTSQCRLVRVNAERTVRSPTHRIDGADQTPTGSYEMQICQGAMVLAGLGSGRNNGILSVVICGVCVRLKRCDCGHSLTSLTPHGRALSNVPSMSNWRSFICGTVLRLGISLVTGQLVH